MPHTASHSPQTTSQPSGRKDRLSADPEALFVYGSLQFPEVLQALLGRVPDRTPATAKGWRVAALPDRVYPGLVRGEGIANGLLITGLTRDEWRIIDAFEDEVYELRRLDLTDDQHGWTYVCDDETAATPEDWSAEHFTTRHLATYIERCATWRQRYCAGLRSR